MRKVLTVFALFVSLLIAACSLAGGTSSPSLEGEWTLSTLNNQPLVAGSMITAKFENGEVSGNSGCNSYGGSFSASGEKLAISGVMMTEMACLDQPVMDQESAYLKAIEEATSFSIVDGRLEIQNTSGETTLVFTAR